MPEGIECLQSFGVKFGENSGAPLEKYCCRNSAGQGLYTAFARGHAQHPPS
jgi:hypothetical protein